MILNLVIIFFFFFFKYCWQEKYMVDKEKSEDAKGVITLLNLRMTYRKWKEDKTNNTPPIIIQECQCSDILLKKQNQPVYEYKVWIWKRWCTSIAGVLWKVGTTYPSRGPGFTAGVWWGQCYYFCLVCVVFCFVFYLPSSYVLFAICCQCLLIIHS